MLNLQLDLLRTDSQVRLQEKTLDWLKAARKDLVPDRTLREAETALAASRQRGNGLRRKLLDAGLLPEDVRRLLDERKVVEALPVRAPVGGTVVRFRAALGQAVKAEAPLFEVHDLRQAVLRVHVPERQLYDRVRRRPAVWVGQTGRVRLESDPGFVGRVVVARIGQSLEGGGRAVPAWADLQDRPRTELLPGMTARVTLTTDESSAVPAVPAGAVLRDGPDAYVFVCQGRFDPAKTNAFERRRVETGRADDQYVEILGGLTEGEDEVAVRGVADLQTAYAGVQ